MFTVRPLCKAIIMSVILYIIILINILGQDRLLSVISVVFIIWLYRYLSTLKVYIDDSYLVKRNGKTFKHKTIIMLKNISKLQILVLHTSLPAIIRICTYDEALFLFGLNGRQRLMLEYKLLQLK